MKAIITGSSFASGCMRNLLPGSAPISLQWFSLYLSFSNNCKATAVTHTKRIERNLLRKETSFVCYTSSILRKSRRMKQKEKITHCCEDQNSRLQKIEHNCNSSTKHSYNTKVTHSSNGLWLPAQIVWTMKRISDSTHRFRSPTS